MTNDPQGISIGVAERDVRHVLGHQRANMLDSVVCQHFSQPIRSGLVNLGEQEVWVISMVRAACMRRVPERLPSSVVVNLSRHNLWSSVRTLYGSLDAVLASSASVGLHLVDDLHSFNWHGRAGV